MIPTAEAKEWIKHGKASDMYGKLNDGAYYYSDGEVDGIFIEARQELVQAQDAC